MEDAYQSIGDEFADVEVLGQKMDQARVRDMENLAVFMTTFESNRAQRKVDMERRESEALNAKRMEAWRQQREQVGEREKM